MKIRNFCIISHIDHGKSTLADRLLELTDTVDKRKMHDQILDNMELERERGITIKLQPARMYYDLSGEKYELNLIDTPGHVDFSYEVSRSLEAVEGAILLVDATQGVQAQTLANLEMAKKAGLVILPAINKIDLPESRPEEVAFEIAEILGCELDDILFISAKTGEGVENLIKKIIEKVPAPRLSEKDYFRALVFDSFYDDYRGVVVYVRVMDGELKREEKVIFGRQQTSTAASDVGMIQLGLKSTDVIRAGEVGYIVTAFKEVSQARVGDTVLKLDEAKQETDLLEGYKEPRPMVFAEFFTSSGEDYNRLRDAIGKLALSDASFSYSPVSSQAFGFGFRMGFLGLLHLEIVKERLEREYDLELIVTTPAVDVREGKEGFEEPFVRAEVIAPKQYLGILIELFQKHRGEQKGIKHIEEKVVIEYEMPLSEIIINFYDLVKSVTSGYGSLNYELTGYEKSDLVKLDYIIGGEKFDAFSRMVYKGFVDNIAKNSVLRLKEIIPRQNFEVRIQAAVGAKIIASERIAPFRKDVTEKLYGGDVTRKRKLLEKQKKGKRKMARIGKIDIPTDVFIKLLKS
jgi:GTP-binding protein LepA